MKSMKLSRILSLVLAVTCFSALGTAFSQVAPAAHQGQLPFSAGAAASNFRVDWGQNRMEGFTVWGDWRPRPDGALSGLGLDVEVRDIDFGRSSSLPSNFKQVTGGGGPIYYVRVFRNFQVYGKWLFGFGSMDFKTSDPYYTHDTRNFSAPGGGFQYRLYHHLWARADYEYQMWPDLFPNKNNPQGGTMDPQGFTLGFSYDFRPQWH